MNDISFTKEEARIRLLVLDFSIKIETLLSTALRVFLNIPENSNSFGNTSRSLSFSQKTFLLIDTEYLNSKEKEKFLTFMSIRNQFIHNPEAKDFTSCCGFVNGKDTWLFKQYPSVIEDNKEQRIEKCWNHLVHDILMLISQMLDKHKQKVRRTIYHIPSKNETQN